MMVYTLKDKELATVFSPMPHNASYTSHDIQMTSLMRDIVTEEIVKEIRESWYTLMVDGILLDVKI